ncbi:DUF3108 domain-containing protein [Psychromonas aquatilis]|uniref:DUF3108 domain-containing protein n=1 Tax=Psychromonas aquatilis TaxID=2005072 RepID=A0ABU9GR09_9GAMM
MNTIRFFMFISGLLLSLSHAHAATVEKGKPNQRFTYEVSYLGMSIGEMTQAYQWQGSKVSVDSAADFSFMLFSFGGNQQSELDWDEDKGLFYSRYFQRESEGFSTVKMTATFDQLGQSTEIVNNGETSTFTSDGNQIVDFNAINLQISEGLKRGQTLFEFYMQTSTKVSHYFFEVKGKEMVKTPLGEVEAYRVEQIRKSDRTFVTWFAPKFDHQMVKFEYQRRVLDIEGELIDYRNDI